MCNVRMTRPEPGLVSIPLERDVYCENCRIVSTSAEQRCRIRGSEQIVRLASLIPEQRGPSLVPELALAA
jgi:hypothetical protein